MTNYLPAMHVDMNKVTYFYQAAQRDTVLYEKDRYGSAAEDPNSTWTDYKFKENLIYKYLSKTNGFKYGRIYDIYTLDGLHHYHNREISSGKIDVFKYTVVPVEYDLEECKTVYADVQQHDMSRFTDMTTFMNDMLDTNTHVIAFLQPSTNNSLNILCPGEVWHTKINTLRRRVKLYAILGVKIDGSETGNFTPRVEQTSEAAVIQKMSMDSIIHLLDDSGLNARNKMIIDEETGKPKFECELKPETATYIQHIIADAFDNKDILPPATRAALKSLGCDMTKVYKTLGQTILRQVDKWLAFELTINETDCEGE